MRILNIIQRYPPALGGSEHYFARLSEFLVGRGHDVTVWTSNARDLEAFWSPDGMCDPHGVEQRAGVRVHRFPLWRMKGRRWLLKPLSMFPLKAWQNLTLPCNPISFPMWKASGRPNQFDAVHAGAFPYAFPIRCGLRAARRSGVPFLLTPFLHLGDPLDRSNRTRRQYTSPALRQLLREADFIFAQTDAEREAVLEMNVRPDRVAVQGLGVDRNECTGGDRSKARKAWGVGPEEVVVGHLANLSHEKGTTDLLRAANQAAATGSGCVVVLAGPDMPNFRKFWNDFLPAIRVVRSGVLSEQQKRDFFAGLDLFALPSRCDSFGLVLLEAWANGLPNLAYRAGGPGELIRPDSDGLLARCGDVAGLADQLRRLLGDGPLRRRLGAEGRRRAAEEFAWTDKLHFVERVIMGLHDAARHPSARRMLAAP